ncbi:MAG: P-loop NTPase fold protein, partial [Bacteroidia bacterium]
MVPTQIGYCPITGQLIMDLKILSTYFEYSINFNQINYKLRWSINEKGDPAQYIKPNEKIVLQSMLNNNEWPLEEETIISEEFISQLIRLAEYPRDFKEKLNYYLLKCYLNGGREYKKFQFDVKKRLEAYAEDEDEFNRIIKGLNSKKLVNLINTNDFTLSEAGIQLSEQLNQLKIDNEPVWSAGMHKPRITVIGVKEDKFYIDKFQKLFGKYGISVISYDGIDDNNGYATVSNIKNGLYSNETDYVVFIKSESSDRSSSFGSLLDIAIEAHENTDKKNHKYIFVAFVDGSTTKTRPRIDNYHSNFYDFRITTNRKRLALAIRQDWQMRINASEKIVISEELVREFKFPPIDLKEGEEYWLKLLYQNFISGTQPHFSNFISLHWKFLPKGFDPYKINRLLAESGSNITIYGIWAIDPKSKYLQGVEDLIFAIKDILEERGNAEEITSEILLPRLNHPVVDIIRCLRLLSGLGGFLDWYGGKDDGTGIKIKIKDEIQLNKYNDFKSLEETFQENHKDQFKKNNSSDTDNSKKNVDELLNSKMDLKNIHSHKTKFILRDANNIKPVMGVLELSADLAEVIHTLPIDKEKGQMIGVFGKWGRGKTFLLKEIWNFLEKKEDTKYIKIEYHAWKYQETPASWAYLYENFVSEYLGAKKNLCYLYRLSRLNFKRLG